MQCKGGNHGHLTTHEFHSVMQEQRRLLLDLHAKIYRCALSSVFEAK